MIEENFDLEELDEIEDFDLVDSDIMYEVWLLGDDANDCATELDYCLDTGYTDEVEARKCFDYFSDAGNLKEFLEINQISIPAEVAHLYVQLEATLPSGPDIMECLELLDTKEVVL